LFFDEVPDLLQVVGRPQLGLRLLVAAQGVQQDRQIGPGRHEQPVDAEGRAVVALRLALFSQARVQVAQVEAPEGEIQGVGQALAPNPDPDLERI